MSDPAIVVTPTPEGVTLALAGTAAAHLTPDEARALADQLRHAARASLDLARRRRPHANMKIDQNRHIVARVEAGATYAAVAADLGISPVRVGQIYRRWRDRLAYLDT